jgi:hypothetical protein
MRWNPLGECDPDLYARDPRRFVATSQALAIVRDELAAAEE